MEVVWHRDEVRIQKELGQLLALEEEEIRQKSRENWLTMGDRNTDVLLLCLQAQVCKKPHQSLN